MAITEEDKKILEEIDRHEPKAHCLRAKIAAAIVKDGEILVCHSNDWHPETPCDKIGCIRNIKKVESGHEREVCYGICAEQWCLALCAKKGLSVDGATIYCTKHPCRVCSSLIAEAGIKRVVFQEGYPDVLPNWDILKEKGIIVEQGPNIIYPDDAPEELKSPTI
ncbi:cytidine/deoxycytidylate deaminase family protein [Patescibacteria group bacterium]